MLYRNRIFIALLLVGYLATGSLASAAVVGSTVYQHVDMFSGSTHFTDTFMVGAAGTYQATLTDFEFPNSFTDSGLNVTTATDSLGSLSGPGSFTFDASPGDYFVSMFAEVGLTQAKQRLLTERKKRREARWLSMSQAEREAKQEKKEVRKKQWRSLTHEERRRHREEAEARKERWLEKQLSKSMGLGQYGIEITLLDDTLTGDNFSQAGSPVPLPGAFWLLGTGILALSGLGHRFRG